MMTCQTFCILHILHIVQSNIVVVSLFHPLFTHNAASFERQASKQATYEKFADTRYMPKSLFVLNENALCILIHVFNFLTQLLRIAL